MVNTAAVAAGLATIQARQAKRADRLSTVPVAVGAVETGPVGARQAEPAARGVLIHRAAAEPAEPPPVQTPWLALHTIPARVTVAAADGVEIQRGPKATVLTGAHRAEAEAEAALRSVAVRRGLAAMGQEASAEFGPGRAEVLEDAKIFSRDNYW